MSARKEGWGSLVNAAKAHYFAADGRVLCGRWVSFGPPHWESGSLTAHEWERRGHPVI